MLLLTVSFGLIWAFRESLLITLAAGLIVEGNWSPANAVVLLEEGDRRFEVAAECYRRGTKIVLLSRSQQTRLARLGILPSSEEIARREWHRRNLPDDVLQPLPEVPIGKTHLLVPLSEWLQQHPDKSLHLMCDRFTSRTWDLLVKRTLTAELSSRVTVLPLTHRDYDETNWWRSKRGIKAVLNGYLTLAFHVLRRGNELDWHECTPSDFRSVIASDGRYPK